MNALRVLLVLTALTEAACRPVPVVNLGGALGRAPVAEDSFPRQWDYVTSEARKNAVCCSRQAGKTSGAGLASEVVLSRPETRVIYATLIRRNAKKLFWWPLLENLKERGWSSAQDEANESDMMLWLPNGSFLQALSCEKMADLERIRGDQADLFIVDECQAPRDDVLEALVTKIVPMMLAKRRGRLDLLGTVPEVEPCVFANRLDGIDEKGAQLVGWRTHGWTCFDNPYMPRERIDEEAKESGLYPGHPTYDREFLGLRVKDPSKLAYEYDADRNTARFADVDFEDGSGWRHALGLDLGFQDCDAIVVVAWRREDADRRLYVRYQWAANHQDVDQLATKLHAVLKEFRPNAIVGDHGGHGAVKVLETLKARLGVEVQTKPTDVMVSVGLVNDDLRTGRLQLPARSQLGDDLGKVLRTVNPTTRRVEINKKGFHSDLSEALRYAHHAARHWAAKPPKGEETRDERRLRADRERREKEKNWWR